MSSRLPVSVIIPCRDNLAELPAHLRQAAEWISEVEQIIVVDSSSDGTLDFLRRELNLPHVEFHHRPPGLYAAWNFGAGRAASKFVYYSTILDHIRREELTHLVRCAEEAGVDAMVGRPKMIAEQGVSAADQRWPVHDLTEFFPDTNGSDFFLPPAAVLPPLACGLAPKAILGSSASNLYLASTLKECPWPEEFGHSGDTAWFLRWHRCVRLGFVKREIGSFLMHSVAQATAGPDVEALSGRLRRVALQAWEQTSSSGHEVFSADEAAFVRGALSCVDDWQTVLWRWISLQSGSAEVSEKQKQYIETLERTVSRLRTENGYFRSSPWFRAASILRKVMTLGAPFPFDRGGREG